MTCVKQTSKRLQVTGKRDGEVCPLQTSQRTDTRQAPRRTGTRDGSYSVGLQPAQLPCPRDSNIFCFPPQNMFNPEELLL